MRIIVVGVLAASILITAAIWSVVPEKAESTPDVQNRTLQLISKKDASGDIVKSADELAFSLENSNLPVGRVEKHNTEDSWGYAIYIPQTHKNPASKTADKINDSAEKAQNEIYAILDHAINEKEIDFVMAEGDLMGEVPADKIERLSAKINLRDKLSRRINELNARETGGNSLDKMAAAKAMAKGQKALAYLDREIALAGAPYVAKASGAKIELYGSENKETREECTHLVRDYIYQEDRLAVMESGNTALGSSGIGEAAAGNETVSLKSELLRALLSRKSEQNNLYSKFSVERLFGKTAEQGLAIKTSSPAQGDEFDLLIKEIDEIFIEIEKLYAHEEAKNPGEKGPSRSDNPYNEIGSLEEMRKIRKTTEQAIEDVVVNQRNQETAENFAVALREKNKNIGILQFGAGHEQGLVEELQKQGLSVLVVSPKEVEKKIINR
jgi:hypothetical protein